MRLEPIQSGVYDRFVTHCTFDSANAGDIALNHLLQVLFDREVYGGQATFWDHLDVGRLVGPRVVRGINQTSAIVVGGGGLFIRDTNANSNSGWQWNCPVKYLNQIAVPLIGFALGYSRFRGQEPFDPIFDEHIAATVEKAAFFGIRNHGSIRCLQEHLPASLHHKLTFQPCMTTFLARILDGVAELPRFEQPTIALNFACDRAQLRFGDAEEAFFDQAAQICDLLADQWRVLLVAHTAWDREGVRHILKRSARARFVNLASASPHEIITFYRRVSLVVGMRGHSVMIPFGCRTPVVPLISHDKVRFFAEDAGILDGAVDLVEVPLAELAEAVVNQVEALQERADQHLAHTAAMEESFFQTTRSNIEDLRVACGWA